MRKFKLMAAVLATLALLAAGGASAQDWPAKSITLIVPFAAGGGINANARVQALALAEVLGQGVIVENIGAAGGTVGTSRAAKAAPDGYTLLIGNSGTHAYAALAAEPRLGPALMGAPPALGEIVAGRASARALFLVAAFCFAFGALQTLAFLFSPSITWQQAVDFCGVPGEATRACFAANAQAELFGQLVVWPVGFIGSIAIARWIEAWARRKTRDSAAAAMARNEAVAPILFLRAFKNDQVALPAARPSPMRWLLQRTRMQHYLDHMLVEEFAMYGPTVALGRPGQGVPPFGVWRTYLHDATDALWQAEVARLAEAARAIVMVVDDTGGVLWELEHIAAANLLHKTLFIAPPDRAGTDNAGLWQAVEVASGLRLPPTRAADGRPVLAAFAPAEGPTCVATSERFVASDYLAALRWFFRASAPHAAS